MKNKDKNTEISQCVQPAVISCVYIVQNKYNLIIYGCFKTRQKAQKYTNKNNDFEIIKCYVE